MPLIRASELAHYGFCKRAWWLGTIKKIPSANQAARQRGTRHHQAHARQVQTAQRRQKFGLMILGSGSLLLLIIVSWWLF